MSDSHLAIKSLEASDVTCAFVKDGAVETSGMHGIAPLLRLIEEGRTLEGYSAADRVVGKAAALLYVYLRVKELYASVMSASAEEMLRAHEIAYSYGARVEGIFNRRGDGPCPMELAVEEEHDPAQAVEILRAKVREMRK